jgi:hypothetical protein
MRRLLGAIPLAVASLFICSASATLHGDDLGADVNQQLAQARAATARFHDPAEALAEGYIDLGVNPAEGGATEYVNFDLIFSCTLDVQRPQALQYVSSGNGLRLIAVEYGIPMACAPTPPEDFLPGAGEWEPESEAPVWTKVVYIWSGKSQQEAEGQD